MGSPRLIGCDWTFFDYLQMFTRFTGHFMDRCINDPMVSDHKCSRKRKGMSEMNEIRCSRLISEGEEPYVVGRLFKPSGMWLRIMHPESWR
jgi:hypothetical protein